MPSGGPPPSRGLVLGGNVADAHDAADVFCNAPLLLSVVVVYGMKLGGHKVRKARGNVADAHDAADVQVF